MRRGWRGAIAAALMAGVVMVPTASAQTPPAPPAPQQPPATADPAAIGQGLIDQQRRAAPPAEQVGDPVTGDAAPATPDVPEGAEAVRFALTAIRFDPSRFLSDRDLQAAAAPLIGKEVSLADVGVVVRRVNALYAGRGIVTARAYLPPQRIEGGTIRIALIEGRLGEMKVEDGKYTSGGYARRRLDLSPGEVVDLAALRRRITAFNRANDVQLRAQLQPGADVGLTDILVSLAEPPRNGLQAFVDTYGYQSTGRYQGGAVLRRNGLLTDGDRTSLFASVSDGGLTGSASYNVSVRDVRLGASYAHSRISVTRGPSANLDIDGSSDVASLNAAAPIAAGDGFFLTAVGTGSYIASRNKLANRTVSTNELVKATLGYSLQADLGGTATGILNQTINLVQGDDSLDTGKRTFAILNADASVAAALGSRLNLRVAAAGQYSGSNFVPSSQIFQVGGPVSVRGFQPGTGSGRSGFFSQVEMHYLPWLPVRQLDVFAFFDSGKTYSPDFGSRGLGAIGAGARLPIWRFALDATLGVPVSDRLPREGSVRADVRLSLGL